MKNLIILFLILATFAQQNIFSTFNTGKLTVIDKSKNTSTCFNIWLDFENKLCRFDTLDLQMIELFDYNENVKYKAFFTNDSVFCTIDEPDMLNLFDYEMFQSAKQDGLLWLNNNLVYKWLNFDYIGILGTLYQNCFTLQPIIFEPNDQKNISFIFETANTDNKMHLTLPIELLTKCVKPDYRYIDDKYDMIPDNFIL